MLGGARDDARQYYGQIVSELETIAGDYLANANATVADTLMATSRVYELFQSVTPADDSVQQIETPEDQTESDEESAAVERMKQRQAQQMPQRRDGRRRGCVQL
jgi:glutathione S-transferase